MDKRYVMIDTMVYRSPRYGKEVVLEKGYRSDGASGAVDIDGPVMCYDLEEREYVDKSLSWWVHDKLCDTGVWADGTPCSNWQASMVLKDILKAEGHWLRDSWWMISTWLFRAAKTRRL